MRELNQDPLVGLSLNVVIRDTGLNKEALWELVQNPATGPLVPENARLRRMPGYGVYALFNEDHPQFQTVRILVPPAVRLGSNRGLGAAGGTPSGDVGGGRRRIGGIA